MMSDMVRVWDLSSDVPHRPTVSNSSPQHSSSPSKSLPGSCMLLDLNESRTPVISRLMSPPTTPKSFDCVSVATGADFTFTNAQRRQPKMRESRVSLLGEFIHWDHYRQSSENSPQVKPVRSLSRHPSVKRTDFTSRVELEKQGQQGRLVFHRGFFRRNSGGTRSSVRKRRLRNRAEVEASLDYANIRSFDPREVISSERVILYRHRSITRRCPGVKIASEIPVKRYVKALQAKDSVKGPKIRKFTASTIRRSNTCPGAVRNIRRRSYAPETRALHKLWAEYVSLVIAQRIELRLLLSRCDYETAEKGLSNISPFNASSARSSLLSIDRKFASLRMNC